MEFSAYQNAIFAFLASTVRNLIVRAGAGSGKTTMLTEIVKRLAKLRRAAALLESHFQARELAQEAVKHALGEVSCLLKPQAG